jgi:hypothetical protein
MWRLLYRTIADSKPSNQERQATNSFTLKMEAAGSSEMVNSYEGI